MMTPTTQQVPEPRHRDDAPEETWAELPLIDDGTMSIHPEATRVEAERLPERYDGLWATACVLAAAIGLTLALALAPGLQTAETPSALSVLAAQSAAMGSADPRVHARAVQLGKHFLENAPESPYRDMIAEGQAELEATER